MLWLWLRDKQGNRVRIHAEPGFIQILLVIQQDLTRTQQLRRAAELIERIPDTEMRKKQIEFNNMIEEVDSELEEN